MGHTPARARYFRSRHVVSCIASPHARRWDCNTTGGSSHGNGTAVAGRRAHGLGPASHAVDAPGRAVARAATGGGAVAAHGARAYSLRASGRLRGLLSTVRARHLWLPDAADR